MDPGISIFNVMTRSAPLKRKQNVLSISMTHTISFLSALSAVISGYVISVGLMSPPLLLAYRIMGVSEVNHFIACKEREFDEDPLPK